MTQQTELDAAYERINELEHALKDIRAMTATGDDESDAGEFDAFDVIERIVAKANGALDDKTIVTAPTKQ